LEKFQENGQRHQEVFFQSQDSRDCQQKSRTLGAHELGQQMQIEAIKYGNQLCFTINSLWNTFHSMFNTALHQQIDTEVLEKIVDKSPSFWALFSKEEFRSAIANCNNSSTPEPDKLS